MNSNQNTERAANLSPLNGRFACRFDPARAFRVVVVRVGQHESGKLLLRNTNSREISAQLPEPARVTRVDQHVVFAI